MNIHQLTVKPTRTMSDIELGIRFKIKLYEGNPYFVPPLIMDEMNTLNPKKNAAFDHCEAQSFLAYRDGEIVGRITGIVHRLANETWNEKTVRFSYFDFIDDPEVSSALLSAVEEWGRSKGMTSIEGPISFTDMDQEGMLIEGFDELATMATFYNYPYYPEHMERLKFEKAADWVEFKIEIPQDLPAKFVKVAEIVAKRYKLRNLKFNKIKDIIAAGYDRGLFELVNRSYVHLHGFTQLSEKQIKSYVKLYLPLLNPSLISLIVDENDKLVGMGVAMPSMSKALQKAKGKFFPFGWFYLLKALRGKNDLLDLLIVAIDPEYQGRGVNALLFTDLQRQFYNLGFKYAESNPELELNEKVQAQWEYFPHRQHKRRRSYRKTI